jgi:hypothetical protein
MGIAVETSMKGRTRAAMAAGAVRHEPDQDEDHAGDTDQVRRVLGEKAFVGVVVAGRHHVDEDVQGASGHHDREAEPHEQREPADVAQRLYHQHAL